MADDVATALIKARHRLDNALAEALQKFHGSSDGGRQGIILALAGACEFILKVVPESGRKFRWFYMVLLAALHDLERGVMTPMLKKNGQGREKASFGYLRIQMQAVATMASLMNIGSIRADAAKKVADTLERCGLHGATKRAVEKWYDEMLPSDVKRKGRPRKNLHSEGQAARGIYVAGTNELVIDLHRKGRTHNEIRDALLDELSSIVGHWRPSPEQRTYVQRRKAGVARHRRPVEGHAIR